MSGGDDAPLRGIPIFGVCLGLQAMGFTAGGTVAQAKKIMHGKASLIRHDDKGLFQGMPNPFSAIRYHSLVVTRESVPEEFEISAFAEDDGEIMGLRHKKLPIEGVQSTAHESSGADDGWAGRRPASLPAGRIRTLPNSGEG